MQLIWEVTDKMLYLNLLSTNLLNIPAYLCSWAGSFENDLVGIPEDRISRVKAYMGLVARKPVFGILQTTQAPTSLRIRSVWSAPLLFTFWKVPYVNSLQVKFQFSS